jgi:Spy/CpxP family protein refolding chaperone
MKGEGMDRRQNVENELNLTQDQKDRMAKARENARTQIESIRNDKTLTQDQKKEKMMSLRKQQQEEMKKILTQEQIEKMKSQKKDRGAKTTK